jgi:predicted membrane channel-forming protein YqfA (hemolysin III family)
MNILNIKAFDGLLFLLLAMAALLFIPAWTLDFWQAWTFLAVYFASSFAITLYFMKKDPKLLERRMSGGPTAEKETTQKIIMCFASVGFIGLLVAPVLDHRFAWSHVPPYAVLAGDVLVVLGWLAIFFVFKENTFTSATIELAPDQKVISNWPVRARTAPDVRRRFSHAIWHTDCARFVVGVARLHRDDARAYLETI